MCSATVSGECPLLRSPGQEGSVNSCQAQPCDPQPAWEQAHTSMSMPLFLGSLFSSPHPNQTWISGWGSPSIPNTSLFPKL